MYGVHASESTASRMGWQGRPRVAQALAKAIALARICNIMERILVCQNLDPVDLKANMTTFVDG